LRSWSPFSETLIDRTLDLRLSDLPGNVPFERKDAPRAPLGNVLALMIWRPEHLTRSQAANLKAAAWKVDACYRPISSPTWRSLARWLSVRMAVSKWAKQLRQHQGDVMSLKNSPNPGRPPRVPP